MNVLQSFDLTGKTALVTGCNRGIGQAMAVAMAEAGADVIGVSAALRLHRAQQTAVSTGWKTTDWATADPETVAWLLAAKRMAVVEERLLNCTSMEHGRYRPTPTALAGDLSGV